MAVFAPGELGSKGSGPTAFGPAAFGPAGSANLPPTTLVLASRSSGRLKTLRGAGVWPVVVVPDVDEDEVAATLKDPSPEKLVSMLALAKAEAAAELIASGDKEALAAVNARGNDEVLVVGADSMLELGGTLAGKPHTPEVATARIKQMRGTNGTLWSGHGLVKMIRQGDGFEIEREAVQASSAIVHFGEISDAEIDAYVATGEPLEVAGSFTIDALGGPFIEGVTGDPHGVVGVSLPLLRKMARKMGISWAQLWEGNPAPEA